MNNILFNPLHHPNIKDGYMISPYGDIKFKDINESYKPSYHSSNGYDYALFITNENKTQLFPIDEIIGMVYIPIPNELIGKKITIKHIDGDTRNISLDNMEWIEDIEIWKVVTYPGVKPNTYEVSNHGRIRNITTGHGMNIYVNNKKYSATQLMTNQGKSKPIELHRLMSYEFLKRPDDISNYVVNHIDGVKTNSSPKNIEYVSQKENVQHAMITELSKHHVTGEDVNTAILSNDVVEEICQLLTANGGDLSEIKVKYPHIKTRLIRRIMNKETWRSISNKYDFNFENKFRLSNSTIYDIAQLLVNPDIDGDIDKVYDVMLNKGVKVTKSQIYNIKYGKSSKLKTESIIKDHFRTRLTDEDVHQICKALRECNKNIDEALARLSDNPRVNRSRLLHILNHESHADIYKKYFNDE